MVVSQMRHRSWLAGIQLRCIATMAKATVTSPVVVSLQLTTDADLIDGKPRQAARPLNWNDLIKVIDLGVSFPQLMNCSYDD